MTEIKKVKIYIYSALSFFIPLIIYTITLAPTVSWVDSDELATASSLLKTAHPTGYPLFTILGKIFTFIPAGDEVYRLNLMSAIVSSVTVFIFFNMMFFLFSELKLSDNEKKDSGKISDDTILNISLTSSLLLAFSRTFWDNANVIEVYSLHSFFLVLLLYIFLKAINVTEKNSDNFLKSRYWLLFALILGLSFANHMTTIFLLPGFAYLYFSKNGFSKAVLKNLNYLAIPFLFALTLYIYLIVRADNSMLSWGHTNTFDNFTAHITGRQYNTAMFRSAEDVKIQLSRFIGKYPKEFVYLNLLLIIPGLIELFNRSRKFFYFTLILFASCILLASSYTIYDIYSYFLLCSIVTAIWNGFGLVYIVKRFSDAGRVLSYVLIFIFLIPLSYNYSENDKSRDYMVKDYVFNLFNSASNNSIVITNYNPTYYFQYVKKARPDIVFINRDYMYNKWYLNSLLETIPEIIGKSKPEYDAFETELGKLHSNKSRYLNPRTQADNQDIMKFQKTLRNLLNSIIENNIAERDVYTTMEIDEVNDEKFAEPFIKTPEGVLLKLSSAKDTSSYKKTELKYDLTVSDDYFKNYVMDTYFKAHMNEAKYLLENSDYNETVISINKALAIKPDSKEAKQLLQKAEQLKSNQSK